MTRALPQGVIMNYCAVSFCIKVGCLGIGKFYSLVNDTVFGLNVVLNVLMILALIF